MAKERKIPLSDEERKAKRREYYYANRDVILANQKEWIERRKAGLPPKGRQKLPDIKERRLAQSKASKARNKEKVALRRRVYHQKNKDKQREKRKAYRHANKEKMAQHYIANREKIQAWKRASLVRTKYGLTMDELEAKKSSQGNSCGICGVSEKDAVRGFLCVDHDHQTGFVRGMLCSTCNLGLSHARDDIAVLMAAVDYLERKDLWWIRTLTSEA